MQHYHPGSKDAKDSVYLGPGTPGNPCSCCHQGIVRRRIHQSKARPRRQTNRRSVVLQDANTYKGIFTAFFAIFCPYSQTVYIFFLCFIHPLDMSWKKWLEDSISFQDNQLNSIIILKGRVYLLSRKWAWNARVVNPHESWVSDCTKKRLALKAICGHKHTSGETIDHVKRGWQYVHAWHILKHQTTGMANMAWHHLAPIHCPVALPLGTSTAFPVAPRRRDRPQKSQKSGDNTKTNMTIPLI